jgi:DNA-binding GntR family transcriptional regulator
MDIEPEVLKDKIFLAIQDAILRGDLQPGEKLVEIDLMKSLEVSRTPLRDAFWLLEKQGYVRMVPNKGTFVIVLSRDQISEIYAIRGVLEAWAVALAMARAKPKDFRELRQQFRRIEQTANEGDLLSNFKIDLEFHQKIWRLSGNTKLEEVLNNICPSLFTYLLIKYQGNPSVMREGVAHHLEILRLLESKKDSAEVEKQVRANILRLGEMTTKFI